MALTRRGLLAAGAGLPGAMALAAGAAVARPAVPPGATDCHVHVLDPARFPFVPERQYTPGSATVAQVRALHARLGITRVILVQNGVYGADNACLLDAMGQFGAACRGVATVTGRMTAADIDALHRAGVRGARINIPVRSDQQDKAVAEALFVGRMIPPSWHVHINAELPALAAVAGQVAALPSPAVLDHFAHANASGGLAQPGMAEVLGLLRRGRAVVKLSAPYQISTAPGYADVLPIARAFIEAAPEGVMWGSDWPHTGGTRRPANQSLDVIEPFRPEDDQANFDLLAAWAPDPALRRQILVDTPARVYGFGPTPG